MKRLVPLLILSLSLFTEMKAEYHFNLPDIPTDLMTPRERADFLVLNFWKNQNLDILLTDREAEEFEQNFVDFINIFPHANDSVIPSGINNLLSQLSRNKKNYMLGLDLTEKYLFELDSPLYNEEYFILFMDEIMKSSVLSEKEKVRPTYMLEEAMKNRKGERAADFIYENIDGEEHSLSDTKSEGMTLLIFFDPDCDHCKEVISQLKENQKINMLNENNCLNILAIYSGEEKDLWRKYAQTMPENWTIGYDPMNIYDEELYYLREMPTIYLLDSSHRILGKNLRIEKLYEILLEE